MLYAFLGLMMYCSVFLSRKDSAKTDTQGVTWLCWYWCIWCLRLTIIHNEILISYCVASDWKWMGHFIWSKHALSWLSVNGCNQKSQCDLKEWKVPYLSTTKYISESKIIAGISQYLTVNNLKVKWCLNNSKFKLKKTTNWTLYSMSCKIFQHWVLKIVGHNTKNFNSPILFSLGLAIV